MKFGKLLQSRMCADEMGNLGIGEHFLRYKALKKQLKALSGARAHGDLRVAVASRRCTPLSLSLPLCCTSISQRITVNVPLQAMLARLLCCRKQAPAQAGMTRMRYILQPSLLRYPGLVKCDAWGQCLKSRLVGI